MTKLLSYFSLMFAYFKVNVKAQLEYRGAFVAEVVSMILNDCVWVSFWCFFFNRFPVVKGWTATDVITLWAVTATGYGIGGCLFANAYNIASLIAKGQLDTWLVYPRRVLSHLILERMSASAFGDVIFGVTVFMVFTHPSLPRIFFFCVLMISAAAALLAVRIAAGSLSLFIGNAQLIAQQWQEATVGFSTYPSSLFEGTVKMLLFTLIPAAFISYLPVEAIRNLSFPLLSTCCLGSFMILSTAVAIFHLGLTRYESGNLMEMRG